MRYITLIALAGCVYFDPATPPPPQTDAPAAQPDAPAPIDSGSLGDVTNALLREWSGCLSLANFTSANMTAWGSVPTSNVPCADCHGSGGEGFIAALTTQPFFDTIAANKFFMLQYWTVDLSQGGPAAKVIINQVSFAGVASGQPPHQEHPTFNATMNAGMTALVTLTDLTNARKAAGTCDPPRLP